MVDVSVAGEFDRLSRHLEIDDPAPEEQRRKDATDLSPSGLLTEIARLISIANPAIARAEALASAADPSVRGTVSKQLRALLFTSDDRFLRIKDYLRALARHINLIVADFSGLTITFATDYSAGSGLPTPIPWLRIFSAGPVDGALSAQAGFYLVILYSDDGQRAYLSLNQGTDSSTPKQVARQVEWARDVLSGLASESPLVDEITLQSSPPVANSARAKAYEAGNIGAVEYAFNGAGPPTDASFRSDLERMVRLQEELYLQSRIAAHTVAPPREHAMHVLLKWNPEGDGADTLKRHRATAAQRGAVWWGNGTSGSKTVAQDKLDRLAKQIAAGIETWVYFYKTGSAAATTEVWRARLKEATRSVDDVDDRLPDYDTGAGCNLFVLVEDFQQLLPGEVLTTLALFSSDPLTPVAPSSLKNQTTPMWVAHLEEDDADATTHLSVEGEFERLISETSWPGARLQEILDALLGEEPQVVFAGPPGTSKTHVALAIANYVTKRARGRLTLVQFHPSYGYESFVEGLRPVVRDGGIDFELVKGTVREVADKARLTKDTFVIVVDEMNRANLPRVLGELLFLFEYRDARIDLQYTKDFSLPANVVFIGTMNTADRSIRSLDAALRRRLAVFECLPDVKTLERWFMQHGKVNLVPDLLAGFQLLNATLESELDRHHTVGHTFFMRDQLHAHTLRAIWNRKLGPLIEEYFFDQPHLVAQFTIERFWPSVGSG